MADEPTGELDSKTGHEILSFLRNLVDTTRITLLMASHDPLVDKYAQHVLTLKDGMIAAPEKKK